MVAGRLVPATEVRAGLWPGNEDCGMPRPTPMPPSLQAAIAAAKCRRLSGGHLEKLLSIPIACGPGVNVNEWERERTGIICGQFCGVG
jgi:hypothetical protein